MKLLFFHAFAFLIPILPVQLKYNSLKPPAITQKADAMAVKPHYVGEVYGGGVIFSMDEDDKNHGLIVSVDQLSSQAEWGPSKAIPGCDSWWDGASNTNAIMQNGGSDTDAAGLCAKYSHDGFDDWYLPGIDELKDLGRNATTVNKTLKSLANAQLLNLIKPHWSSTQVSSDSNYDPAAKARWSELEPSSIKLYGTYVGDKTLKFFVRAVRRF
jgi:hypothetical protein